MIFNVIRTIAARSSFARVRQQLPERRERGR
jgi:hypothetical protein